MCMYVTYNTLTHSPKPVNRTSTIDVLLKKVIHYNNFFMYEINYKFIYLSVLIYFSMSVFVRVCVFVYMRKCMHATHHDYIYYGT